MFHRLPTIFCHHCGQSVPRAALHCLWCRAPSPLQSRRMASPANRHGRAGAETDNTPPPPRRRVGET